jgi:serine/threonine protein kinase
MRDLNHPNIVKMKDFFIEKKPQTSYLILEKIDGLSLAQCLSYN